MEHILGSREKAHYAQAMRTALAIFLIYFLFSLFSEVISGVFQNFFHRSVPIVISYMSIYTNIISIFFDILFIILSYFLIKLNQKEKKEIYLPAQKFSLKEVLPVFFFSYITIFCLSIILSASLYFLPSLDLSPLEIK